MKKTLLLLPLLALALSACGDGGPTGSGSGDAELTVVESQLGTVEGDFVGIQFTLRNSGEVVIDAIAIQASLMNGSGTVIGSAIGAHNGPVQPGQQVEIGAISMVETRPACYQAKISGYRTGSGIALFEKTFAKVCP